MTNGAFMNQALKFLQPENTIFHCVAGTVLFQEGEFGDCAYVIETGLVEISTSIQGERVVIQMLGPGQIVGEMAIVDDAYRTATATIVVDSKLLVVARLQLQERLREADPVLGMLMRLITQRYRSSITTLKNRTAEQKPKGNDTPTAASDPALDKFRMEGDLRSAIENRCLGVMYQPIVDLFDDRVVGFEALVRWKHRDHGFVPPHIFVRLAEETNLIRAIDEFVLKEAAAGIQHINRCLRPDTDAFVDINVSARQLEDNRYLDLARDITSGLALTPELVRLEITESRIAQEENAESWIRTAKDYGFGVALDDFGKGFSSLSRLGRLDVDTVKIDLSFVRRLGQTEHSGEMLQGIISLLKSMKRSVIAEGIETENQKSLLAQAECPLGQGFFLGKPMPLQEILCENALTTGGIPRAGALKAYS